MSESDEVVDIEIVDPRPDPGSPEAREKNGTFKKGNRGGRGIGYSTKEHHRKACSKSKLMKRVRMAGAFTPLKYKRVMDRLYLAAIGKYDEDAEAFTVQPNVEAAKIWTAYAVGKPTQQIDLKIEGTFSLEQRVMMALVAAGMKPPEVMNQLEASKPSYALPVSNEVVGNAPTGQVRLLASSAIDGEVLHRGNDQSERSDEVAPLITPEGQ